MSELQQLTQQKESIQQNQEMIINWISLKKILSSKFKSSKEAFKALKTDGSQTLRIEDFQDYSKGLDLSLLFKEIELNEVNFGKVWESWEYKEKQNEHKLQIITEKLKLFAMLDDKEKTKESQIDVTSNKSIQKLASNCESLVQVQEKLNILVEENQKQKDKADIIQNEQDCFSAFLTKKNEYQLGDLYINKLQLTSNENVEENQHNSNKIIKSYIEGPSNHIRSITGFHGNTLLQSSLSKKVSTNNIKSYKQSYIKEPLLETSPQKGSYTVRVQPKQNSQEIKSPYEEKQQEERRSHKINRMKGDLQQYISQLFFHEKEFRQNNIINHRPSSEEQKGLARFMNYRHYFQNQLVKPQFQELEESNTLKKFQNIRQKLDENQQQKLSQYNYILKTQPNSSLEKTERESDQKMSINLNGKINTKHSPCNTHRLNLEYLKQEREYNSQQIQQQSIEAQMLE